jgi:hypothetical protein
MEAQTLMRSLRVMTIVTVTLVVSKPAFCQVMQLSTYHDFADYIYNDETYIDGVSSVEDDSVGCIHSNYYTTTTVYNPDWNRWYGNQSSGLGSSAGLAFQADEGYWNVATEGYFDCDCSMQPVSFGPTYSSDKVNMYIARYEYSGDSNNCSFGLSRYLAYNCSHQCQAAEHCYPRAFGYPQYYDVTGSRIGNNPGKCSPGVPVPKSDPPPLCYAGWEE